MPIDPSTAYRIHDIAISNWCARLAFYAGRQVPNLVESPRRAFAELRNLLVEAGELDPSAPLSDIPLPFISIERGAVEINTSIMAPRARVPGPLTDESMRYALEARVFTPLIIDYKISAWGKEIQEMATIADAFIRDFYGKYAYEPVCNPAPWASFDLPIKWGGLSNTTEVDGGLGDRVLRNVLSIKVEGRLFHQPIEVPTAHKFIFSVGQTAAQVVDGIQTEIPLEDVC